MGLKEKKIKSSPTDKILIALAKNTELEQYKLPKNTGYSYRTILRELGLLEHDKYIILLRTEPSKKGGKEKKIYGLTWKGLVYVLVVFNALHKWVDIQKVIEAQSSNMLIFKKWSIFKNAELEELMLKALKSAVKTYSTYSVKLYQEGLAHNFNEFPITHERFTRLILLYPFNANKASEKYLDILKGDNELCSSVNGLMEDLKKHIERDKLKVNLWLNHSTGGKARSFRHKSESFKKKLVFIKRLNEPVT